VPLKTHSHWSEVSGVARSSYRDEKDARRSEAGLSQRSFQRKDDCTCRFGGWLGALQFERELVPTIRHIHERVAAPHADGLTCEPSTIFRVASGILLGLA
jgi:hypothetical protein